MSAPILIANCSGFFGDRLDAAREMVEGGPIDVLTGDWLAELTMLILARQKMKHGNGFARTFMNQMEQVLGTCVDRRIKIVSNAGGLDPDGLALALAGLAGTLGIDLRIGVVSGDDLMPRMSELRAAGEEFVNLDTGETLASAGAQPITANAYLGGEPITAALNAGADVVVTGRVTDAALVIGPAAWHHGWDYAAARHGDQDVMDALAGALVAGHVIECGTQATGGNYAFFTDVPGLEHPGFPIAEVAADGSCVITKHQGMGGMVTVGTVTAQLLYEIAGRDYYNPDVTAEFDTIRLRQVGRDRVEIAGTRGVAAPQRLKVAMNYLGGFRNTLTLVITGLAVEEKADLALHTVAGVTLAQARTLDARGLAAASSLDVAELSAQLQSSGNADPAMPGDAQSFLRITVKDADGAKVGKAFTEPIIEATLASYPGYFPTTPPGPASPFGVYWPATVARDNVDVSVRVGDDVIPLEGGSDMSELTTRLPLGTFVGARSGDKGGNANVGVWVIDPTEAAAVALAHGGWATLEANESAVALADARYAWLSSVVTADGVRELLPECATLDVDVHPLPNLRAINVVIHGLLGRGVAESSRVDPQAKGLGEHLRARLVDIPAGLLDAPDPGDGGGS